MTDQATPQPHDGSSPGPGGDEASGHAGHDPGKKARERSPNVRNCTDHRSAREGVNGGVGGSLDPSSHGDRESGEKRGGLRRRRQKPDGEITRATGKILIDPKLLAEDYDAHRATPRRCGGATACSACRFFAVVQNAQREAAWAANILLRRLWLDDAVRLEAARATTEAASRRMCAADWPAPDSPKRGEAAINCYSVIRQHAPSLSGGVASAVAKMVSDKWRETRWDSLVMMTRSPPFWLSDLPLPIRAQELGGVERRGEGLYALRFSISPAASERTGKEFLLPIQARDGYQRRLLDMLSDVEGAPKIGAAKILKHKQKRGKWMIVLAYSRIVPPRTTAVEAAINRGMRCFLAAVTTDASARPFLYDGHDIEAFLRRIQARRREIQRDIKASNRVGHGRKRALLAIDRLTAAGERWRTTKCQVVAARFVKWCCDAGVSVLYLEDFSGIRNEDWDKLDGGKAVWDRIQEWPYYQLAQQIKSRAEEAGIRVVEVPAQYISRRCPRCGFVDREREGAAPRHLKCSKCGFGRHIDLVAAMNLLARARGEWTEGEPLESGPRRRRAMGRSSRRRGNG